MANLIAIVFGALSVLVLGAAWQWFQVDTLAVNVPLVVACWVALRRDAASAYLVAYVLAMFTFTVLPGPRGASLLALVFVVWLTTVTRTRAPVQQPLRIAAWVVAAALLCDLAVAVSLWAFGGGAGFFDLFWRIGPASALVTGLYALFAFWILARLEPLLQQRHDPGGLLRR